MDDPLGPDVLAGDETSVDSTAHDIHTSDSRELLAEFDPVPYNFILKDAAGQNVKLSPERITNAIIECPKYHVLLDHLMAVLWCLYAKKNLNMLQSNQIHWALKILEGTRDSFGSHTEDVKMAIDHLTDAYVDVCARIDVSKLDGPGNLPASPRTPDGYENFRQEVPNSGGLMNTSIHLTDLVGDYSSFKSKSDCQWSAEPEDSHGSQDPQISENCAKALNELMDQLNSPDANRAQNERKIREMTTMLDELRRMVDNIQSSPLEKTNEIRKLLENCVFKGDEKE